MEKRPRISLTFDDGPNTVTTPEVLDVLKYYKVKASFFLVGKNINPKTAEVVERAVSLGCSIENHSWTHSAFPDLTAEQMKKEVEDTSRAVEEITGRKPEFFRPPYIALNDLMYENIKLPFICGQGCEDWLTDKSADAKAKEVVEKAQDGQIVLLHDLEGNKTTVEALKIIIPALQAMGYEFCTVPELFKKCGVNPVKEKTIWTNLVPVLEGNNFGE